MASLSSADRVALLREQLSGRESEVRSVRRLRQCTLANVLIGAMLRAAARKEQGRELTGLEKDLASRLEALYGPRTAAEFGRIYQEPTSRAGITALFPALVADRPLEEGIEAADVRALWEQIWAEASRLPTVRHITAEEMASGVLTGEEELVLVDAQSVKGTRFEVEDVYEARLRYVKSRCDRRSTEEGKDEIYYASGAAGDTKAGIVVTTPEFGSVVAGSVREFPANSYLFKGAAETFVGGNIQVWEADHSGASHIAKTRQVLADIANQFAHSALEEGPSWGAVFMGLAAAATGLVNWLLGFNKDDLVAEKSFAFSRDALAQMAGTNGGRSELVFDGGSGGQHTLTIEVSFGPVIAAALSHSIFYNGKWTTPVRIPHLVAANRPCMTVLGQESAAVGGRLVAVFRDSSNCVNLTQYTGECWTEPVILRRPPGTAGAGEPYRCSGNPSIARYGPRVAVCMPWLDGEAVYTQLLWLDWDTLEPSAYKHPQKQLYTHFSQPVLGGLGNYPHLWEPLSYAMWIRKVDDDSPAGATEGYEDGTFKGTSESVKHAVHKDRRYLSYQDRDGKMYIYSMGAASGEQWRKEYDSANSAVASMTSAVLGAHEDAEEVLCFARQTSLRDGLVTLILNDGELVHYSEDKTITARHDFEICAHNGTLHLLYW